MKKNAQAALEFLTTYGWAFIIVLASIGALVYFGVIDPQIFIPERCLLGTDFVCKDYRLTLTPGSPGTAHVQLMIVNSLGEIIDANITAVYQTEDEPVIQCLPLASDWISGTDHNVTCELANEDGDFAVDEKSKVLLNIEYTSSTGGFPHIQEGEVYATVFEVAP